MYEFVSLGFFLFLHSAPVINGVCTKNPDFIEPTEPNDVFLCDTDSTCNKTFLTNGTTYVGCKQGNGSITKFFIGVIEMKFDNLQIPFVLIKCLMVDGWSIIIPCKFVDNFQFVQTNIFRLQYYVVVCDNSTSLFPNEDQTQIQIPFIRNTYDYLRMNTNNSVLSVTITIPCNSQCMEKNGSYKITYNAEKNAINDIDPNNNALLRLLSLSTNKTSMDDYFMKYKCSNGDNVSPWTIKFYVANKYEGAFISKFGQAKVLDVIDAGTELRCAYFATLDIPEHQTIKKSEEKPQKVFIYLSVLNAHNIEVSITSIYAESITIPEKPSFRIATINCYIGNLNYSYQSNDGYRYYKSILKNNFEIGSSYMTSYLLEDNNTVIDHDVEDSSILKCNRTYYQKFFSSPTMSLRIGVLFTENLTTPYSRMIFSSRPIKFMSDSNRLHFNRSKTLKMVLFCFVDNLYYTTPVEIFSGQRGILTFSNVFPDYTHKYSLRSFVYKCVGEFVISTYIVCVNCTDDFLIIAEDSTNVSYITIPKSVRKNIVLQFFCYGKALKYRTWNDTLVLHIIAYDYTDFNDTYRFFMVKDRFNCITKFSIKEGNISKEIKMPMPTSLMIDGVQSANVPNTVPRFELIPNRITYLGCCEIYKDKKKICNQNWQDILVGNHFIVKWSLDLDNIYPNFEIRCHTCVNYTSMAMDKCINEHKINAHIAIDMTKPDNSKERVSCADKMFSVRSPKQMLKPDKKTFYRMSDFDVTLICCVRGQEFRKKIHIKSCNENPPTIRIIPPDKHLFAVGESFSCTTDDKKCVQGISYLISITVEGLQPQTIRAASLQLLSHHVGNRIKIVCLAGTAVEKTDSRVVRVEEASYNVTIIGLLPILWYGRYLQCTAQGFPPPDIYWIQIEGKTPLRISEYSLLIGPWDSSGEYTVICEAKNSRGIASRKVSFKIYNSRLLNYHTDLVFYLVIPGLTLLFVCLIVCSMLLTFQEAFFGVPIFSTYRANAMKIAVFDKSKKV